MSNIVDYYAFLLIFIFLMVYLLWLFFYFVCLILIGEISRKKVKTLDDFLLAGRKHGVLVISGSLIATVVGAGSTIGVAGVAYYIGISAMWYLLSACIALFFLAFTLAPKLREMSLYTVPEFIKNRYGKKAGDVAIFLSIIALAIFLSAQFYALGVIFHQLTNIPMKLGIISGAILVIIYTLRGGALAVHFSDNLQIFIFIGGILLLCITGLNYIEGIIVFNYPPIVEGFENMGRNWFHPLEKRISKPWDIFSLGTTILGWIIMSTTWHITMQSTAQRLLSAKDANIAKKSCIIAALVLIPISLFVALAGMISRIICPDLSFSEGLSQVKAIPALIKKILSPFLGGLLFSALIAAVMSTCDSVLLAVSTIILKDLQVKIDVKSIILITGVLSTAVAVLFPRLIELLEWTAAIYCVSLTAPLILGIYWQKASETGVIVSIFFSTIIAIIWRFLGIESITKVHFLIPTFLVSLLTMFLFRKNKKC